MKAALIVPSLLGLVLCGGCSTTRFYQRQALADRAGAFDQDRQVAFFRDKIEQAREGGFGGFGGSAAGGCGCE